MRKFLALAILTLCLASLSLPPASMKAQTDPVPCEVCEAQFELCLENCIEQAGGYCPGTSCAQMQLACRRPCDTMYQTCLANCEVRK
ncbi:MAG TPA: hypothetical protein VN228_20635 [Pyrinomonadaceae bacterium]|nr:hypothetical protein [Pyrinomonadaceae bacterium]